MTKPAGITSDFGQLLSELLTTRAQYESLRIGGAPFSKRADMLDRLHTLRHDMERLAQTMIEIAWSLFDTPRIAAE